jgi:NAD-dependent deacetylase
MAVILVEGDSDRIALEVLAERLDVALPSIVATGGAGGVRRAAAAHPDQRLLGLVDAAELDQVAPVVDRVFVCEPDLEAELVRGVGVAAVLELIASQGEADSLRRLQNQPAQRGRPIERQLARFFGGRSGNKARYARLLAERTPLHRIPPPLLALLTAAAAPLVVVLTGAGISAESGLRTFRDAGGLWEGFAIADVATPEGFARDPDTVLDFYDARRRAALAAAPHAAHLALARLERELDGGVLVVTQNVDDLHERAGSAALVHMHGELLSALCTACSARTPWAGDLASRPPCPTCGRAALRPDIVWFGEMPYALDRIEHAVRGCDVFVSIGTSGEVYPAAGYAALAAASGARTVELNLVPSAAGVPFDVVIVGPASDVVPAWVAQMLADG